jgi:hypothetical protein
MPHTYQFIQVHIQHRTYNTSQYIPVQAAHIQFIHEVLARFGMYSCALKSPIHTNTYAAIQVNTSSILT